MDWIAPLIALTCMEVVLGIDNIIFIAILAARLPEAQQAKARTLGLLAALVTRIALLFTISLIMSATQPIFYLTDFGVPESWLPEPTFTAAEIEAGVHSQDATAADLSEGSHESKFDAINGVSWRDLILLFGGAFLIFKSVREVHHKIEGEKDDGGEERKEASFGGVIFQIMLLDMVFSLDSVITAVGMADELWVMIVAVVLAVGFMLFAAGPVSQFVETHPTIKVLALSFLILIGFTLAMDGLGFHISKGYIYTAMVFALAVELINMKVRARIKPDLKQTPTGTVDAVTG